MSGPKEDGNTNSGSLADRLFASHRLQLLAVLLLFSTLAFSKLGTSGMAVWDDGYYAQKAKEISTSGDFLTMHYNGRPTFDNPPFFMWLQAVSYKIWGISEYAAKLPSAVFGTLTVLLIFLFGSRLRDANYGLLASLILALTQPFVRYSRRGMIDVTLSFFVLAAFYFAWRGAREDKRWFYLWAVACGISVLLKSVLGLFPVAVIILWLAVSRRTDILLSRQFLMSVLLAVICFGWWYVYEIVKWGRSFSNLHFGWLIWARGFVRQEGQGHWWEHLSYLKDLLKYYWPWLPVSVWGCFIGFKKRSQEAIRGHFSLWLIWILMYLFVLSVMEARRVWYIMPVFPALAFLSADAVRSLIKSDAVYPRISKFVFLAFLVTVAVINFTPLKTDKTRSLEVRRISPYVRYYSKDSARLLAYKLDYYGLNNALLFYSDRGADICRDVESLRQNAAGPSAATCLVETSDYQAWPGDLKDSFRLVKKAGTLMYLTNGPLLPDTLHGSLNI